MIRLSYRTRCLSRRILHDKPPPTMALDPSGLVLHIGGRIPQSFSVNCRLIVTLPQFPRNGLSCGMQSPLSMQVEVGPS
jgi:hypothetical protein